jgi:hypothetical protein
MSPGSSDGIRCDTDGNVWAAAGGGGDDFDGVHVFAPDGTRIGRILLPEKCANLCFGGVKRNRLFMAASQSIYASTEAQGVAGRPAPADPTPAVGGAGRLPVGDAPEISPAVMTPASWLEPRAGAPVGITTSPTTASFLR